MKTCLTILVALLLTTLIFAPYVGAEDYKVYSSDSQVGSKYNIVQQPNGDYWVYPSGKPVLATQVIKRDPMGTGYKVYKATDPILPQYRIREIHEIK